MQLNISIPPREDQIVFNRSRWLEILSDPGLLNLAYRIETNAFGQILMTPPASGGHSSRQGEIAYQIRRMIGGYSLPECPISTTDGIKVSDVGWYSEQRFALVKGQAAFEIAPEICVEVRSPSNTQSEIQTKRYLYFEAGAEEVWICELDGLIEFYIRTDPEKPLKKSLRCDTFPSTIE